MNYRIQSDADDTYWSNADGWVDIKSADLFTQHERDTLRLPMGGLWVPVEEN